MEKFCVTAILVDASNIRRKMVGFQLGPEAGAGALYECTLRASDAITVITRPPNAKVVSSFTFVRTLMTETERLRDAVEHATR